MGNSLNEIISMIENAPVMNYFAQNVTFRVLQKKLEALTADGKIAELAASLKACSSIPEMKAYLPELKKEVAQTQQHKRLFVDMDGTLAVFQKVDHLEQLLEEGYFLNLAPQQNVIDAVRNILNEHPEIDVYIMSSVLSDSKYAIDEKNAWLNKYLPEIPMSHRIFPPCGENKLDYVPGGIRADDHLLDDYTKNLVLWEPPAKGIKLLNGINHTHGSWKGKMMRHETDPLELSNQLIATIKEEGKRPRHVQQEKALKEPTI